MDVSRFEGLKISIASPDSPHNPITLLISISFLFSSGFSVLIASF